MWYRDTVSDFQSIIQFRLSRAKALGATVAVFLFATSAFAGQYELIKGKGVEVCRAYEKNLNSFKPATLMVCERQANPAFQDFAKPVWERLTLDQIAEINVDVADRMISMATPNSEVLKQPKSERIRKAKELIAAAHNDSWPLSVLRASIDLDNNGKSDSLVKDIHGKCDKQNPLPGVVLRPIGEDTTNARLIEILQSGQYRQVDARSKCEPYKTEGVPTQKSLDVRDSLTREKCAMAMMEGATLKESLGGFVYPDVFRYKNEWYLDVWATERGPNYFNAGRLHVFQHKNGNTVELCEYDFRRSSH